MTTFIAKEERWEVRPGRSLYVRRQRTSADENVTAQVLMVHGSCASSRQYDAMIKSFGNKCSLEFIGYDLYGCGESRVVHPNWGDFSTEQMSLDLEALMERIISEKSCPPHLFVVAHSFAPNLVIRTLSLPNNQHLYDAIKGVVFLSSALGDGPFKKSVTKNGGLPLFKLPTVILRWMQPTLSKGFLDMAFHPKSLLTQTTLREESLHASNANDMYMCKAYYRTSTWCTSDDAKNFKIPSLVMHGQNDKVIGTTGGQHLHENLGNAMGELLVIPETSHQIFQEKPDEVAKFILKFINQVIQ